jgi:hypothetical protein
MAWRGRTLIAAVASAIAILLSSASSAYADVLVDTSHLSGLPCILLGVWYQSYSGGPHTSTATVYRGSVRIAERRLTATTTWRFYSLACPRPGSYRVRIRGAGWHISFAARVPL